MNTFFADLGYIFLGIIAVIGIAVAILVGAIAVKSLWKSFRD